MMLSLVRKFAPEHERESAIERERCKWRRRGAKRTAIDGEGERGGPCDEVARSNRKRREAIEARTAIDRRRFASERACNGGGDETRRDENGRHALAVVLS